MILVNCNLEQMNYLKVQQMQQAVTGTMATHACLRA